MKDARTRRRRAHRAPFGLKSSAAVVAAVTPREGRVVVVGRLVAMRSPRVRRRCGLTGTDEGDDLAAVDDRDAGDDLPVERVKAQGWIGPDRIRDRIEQVFEFR